MRRRSFRQDDGATLVIVLIFMTVFGLILGGLLTETSASTRYTSTISNYEQKLYAADAGVAAGIQQLQQHNQLCPTAGSTATIQTINVNDYDTTVSCEVTAGSTVGGLGYAIITRSSGANSLFTQGGSTPKLINGPMHVGGTVTGGPGIKVMNGTFAQGNSCTSQPGLVALDTGYGWSCSAPEPLVADPTPPTLPSSPRGSETLGSCTYFYPGRYTSPPSLGSGTTYLASGVYYFDNAGQWAIEEVIFAGTPATFEEVAFKSPSPSPPNAYTPMPTCANDDDAIAEAGGNAAEVTGTGAQFILGGNSTIFLETTSQLEVFARTLDGTSETVTATVVAVPDSWDSTIWAESTDGGVCTGAAATSTCAYDFHQGNGPDSVIHGMAYFPDQNVRLWSTNSVRAAVLGGIVAWELELQSSASGSGLQVSASDGAPEPRQIVVTSTAPATPDAAAGRQITSTAVVEIANNPAKTVTVHSWRTRGVTEAL
jgi:Tfp pilus assembly protein PilX